MNYRLQRPIPICCSQDLKEYTEIQITDIPGILRDKTIDVKLVYWNFLNYDRQKLRFWIKIIGGKVETPTVCANQSIF